MPLALIVEDDSAIRSALCRALTERDYAVCSAGTGMGGVQLAVGSGGPDIVLLDLGLPDIDGVDALRMIRAVSRVPVIVVTARDEDSAVVLALDAGADDYMVKPFSGAQLEARIRAVLRRSGALEPPAAASGGSGGRYRDPGSAAGRRAARSSAARVRSAGLPCCPSRSDIPGA